MAATERELIKNTVSGLSRGIILWLLDQKSMSGYEVVKELERSTGQHLTSGLIYPLLYELEKDGFVVGEWTQKGRRHTKYYAITPKGIEQMNRLRALFFTGKRFLEHIAKIYGLTQIDHRVNEMLKDVGLSTATDKPIKAYSAGMFKRLGLAQALISDPELAILDEPTANIDPLGRITLLEKIQTINKEHGTNFLISTHILSDLEKICNWLSIIEAGKIIAQGNVKELAEKYSANIFKIKISNTQLFMEKAKELPMIEKIWVENDTVYCKVNNTDAFCEVIPSLTLNLKLQLKSFQQMVGTLEEIYTKTEGISK
jgi:ABC-type multidrug transport system ATPase subunit